MGECAVAATRRPRLDQAELRGRGDEVVEAELGGGAQQVQPGVVDVQAVGLARRKTAARHFERGGAVAVEQEPQRLRPR